MWSRVVFVPFISVSTVQYEISFAEIDQRVRPDAATSECHGAVGARSLPSHAPVSPFRPCMDHGRELAKGGT